MEARLPEARASGPRRLRVAQLIESLDVGGAERLAVQIANAQAARGQVSHLYVLTEPGELSRRVDSAVRTRYLGLRRQSVGRPLPFALSALRGYRLLSRQLALDGVDVVQTHLPGANFWGLLLAWRGFPAIVSTVHSNQEFNYGRADQAWRARLRRRAYREMLRRCAAVVAVSNGVRDSLLAELGLGAEAAGRITVVPNGVEIPEPLDAALAAQVRARYGIPAGDPLVLGAGRLVEMKNFPVLLEAVAALRRSPLRFRVAIAGDGPQRPYLERRADELGISDQVTFTGNIDDLAELMQSADLFVLPSSFEGLSLTLLEAMARGLPVVGTRIAGVVDVVEDGVSGTLVEPGDAAALAAAMRALLSDPSRRAACGAAGREIVRRHYDFARVAGDLERLYRLVLR